MALNLLIDFYLQEKCLHVTIKEQGVIKNMQEKEKAAIFAWHRPALTAPQQPEAIRAIHAAAQRMDTDYRVVSEECELPLGLNGSYQKRNAALALAALRALPHFLASESEIAHGLATVQWPGRFEEIAPSVMMDGAHNPQHERGVSSLSFYRIDPRGRCGREALDNEALVIRAILGCGIPQEAFKVFGLL